MKLAIMQPYLFPYIGYFHLVNAVDKFVIYDDVTYIKRSWMTRNNLLLQGNPHLFTLSVQGAKYEVPINQVQIGDNRQKLLKLIEAAYRKAPQFAPVFELVNDIMWGTDENLARFTGNGVIKVAGYLGLSPQWKWSSDLAKTEGLSGQDKILDICKAEGATHYINAPGGRSLYAPAVFEAQGLNLSFIESNAVEYKQFDHPFVPNLSILDVLMFNDVIACKELLKAYSLAP